MHALMPTILLRMTGPNAFDADPRRSHQTDSRERLNNPFGEAKGTPLSERIASGKPRSLNNRSKAVKANCSWLDSHRFTQQQIARCMIGDRERIAIALVAELELTLVVGAPQRIRPQTRRKQRSFRVSD